MGTKTPAGTVGHVEELILLPAIDVKDGRAVQLRQGVDGTERVFGDPVEIPDGAVPVFWACGVTPQAAVMESRPPLAISHAPGHMLITDLPDRMFQIP